MVSGGRSATGWSPLDLLAVGAVTVTGGLIRLVSLSRPTRFVFDEFYAADACWYLYASRSRCGFSGEITAVHPPLGKWLMAIGIRLFGYSPGGWRIASVVAGTLTVALVYVLARRLLGSTLAATLASGLLAFDFLHFVMSRTAMLDVFATFFGVALFLFLVLDRDRLLLGGRNDHRHTVRRHGWRIAAGAAGGAAAASKWSGWPLLAGAILLTLWWERSARSSDPRPPLGRFLRESAPSIVLPLVALPAALYASTFVGRVDGSLLAWPWDPESWIRAFVERQGFMLEFHLPLQGAHPYSSPAWSWILLRRPVLFFFSEPRSATYQEILALGDPLRWWLAGVALIALLVLWVRRRDPGAPEPVILAGFAAAYLPWLLLPGREQQFLYYLLPAVPFMYLALGGMTVRTWPSPWGKVIVTAATAGSVVLFAFYYPLLTARPVPYPSWIPRIVFRDCDQPPGRLRPTTEPGPPPEGWCWV
jgi:dolichyl-phosphate-mannose-protein mannosyltransferase